MNKKTLLKLRKCWNEGGRYAFGFTRPRRPMFILVDNTERVEVAVFEAPEEKLRHTVCVTSVSYTGETEDQLRAYAEAEPLYDATIKSGIDVPLRALELHLDDAYEVIDMEEASMQGAVPSYCRKCGARGEDLEPDGDRADCEECGAQGSVDSIFIIMGMI